MKISITILITVLLLLFVAETTIIIRPFKISFGNLTMMFGVLFLVISISLMQVSYGEKRYKKGIQDALEVVTEKIDELREAKDSSSGIKTRCAPPPRPPNPNHQSVTLEIKLQEDKL